MSVRRHVTRHFHARSHILREHLAMKDAAVLLATALDVVLQFGPDRRRPENERLRERLPAVNEADRAAVLATAHEVETRAYDLIPGRLERTRLSAEESRAAFEAAVTTLGEEFPVLSDDLLRRVLNQANYWHLRD